jgi:hypothetical protein
LLAPVLEGIFYQIAHDLPEFGLILTQLRAADNI